MRTVTVEHAVYTYDELDDGAKDRVRQWIGDSFFDASDISYQLEQALDSALGDGHSLKVTEWGESSMRAFLKMEGTFTLGNTPDDGWVGKPTQPADYAGYTVDCRRYGADLYDLDGEYEDMSQSVDDYIHALRSWLQRIVDLEVEYLCSDEYVREVCEVNGYEFYVNGRVF